MLIRFASYLVAVQGGRLSTITGLSLMLSGKLVAVALIWKVNSIPCKAADLGVKVSFLEAESYER
jgi:hypothetical protein